MNMREKYFSSFRFHLSSFSRGFTLIEILLVVVIILIATAVAVPTFRGTFQSTQMRDASRSAVRMARYARSMAILKQTVCTFGVEDHQFRFSCSGGSNTAEVITRRLPDDIRVDRFETEAEQTGTNRVVRFYPSGMNDGFELTLRDQKDRRTLITCDPVSGKVNVEEE